MPEKYENLPAHELVYQRIKDMILFGSLAPGEPLTILGLVDQLNVSMQPVRDAIRRLSAEGAIEVKGNRRVGIPTISPARFEQLGFARLAIEPELSRRATNLIGEVEIEELRRIDEALDLAIETGDVEAYLEQNYRFHFLLYGAAQAPVLLDLAEKLWMQCGPFLRSVCADAGTGEITDHHAEALVALGLRDSEGVARAMAQDISDGLNLAAAHLAGE